MAIKYRYKRTDSVGRVKHYRNIDDLADSFSVQNTEIRRILKDGKRFRGYKVEKLDKPFVFEMPKCGAAITVEGIQCTVINTYDRTFSVMTDEGNRLVQIKDMSFVDGVPDDYDRTKKLAIKKF